MTQDTLDDKRGVVKLIRAHTLNTLSYTCVSQYHSLKTVTSNITFTQL